MEWLKAFYGFKKFADKMALEVWTIILIVGLAYLSHLEVIGYVLIVAYALGIVGEMTTARVEEVEDAGEK